MKVSVIIPVYNEEKTIESCLKAFMQQITPPDEIIIVDNNCTDRTIEIAKHYPVQIIKEKKQGLIYARNTGFNSAKYDILARCDADTIVPPSWVQQIKQKLPSGLAGISGPVFLSDLPLKWFFSYIHRLITFKIVRLFLGYDMLFGSNMAITKQAWEAIKDEICLDDSKVHEDIDITMHLKKKKGIIIYDQELMVSISSRRLRQLITYIDYPYRFLYLFFTH